MKFTIGIPAYKTTYLKECIDSVLCQTYPDFELVIVNDASPQNIDEIVTSYHSNLIRYYKNEINWGAENVVDNWNKCLSYAKGDFFILMGDDDKMQPDYLEEFALLIDKYPACDIYHCRSFVINEHSIPIKLTEPRPEFETVYDSIIERMRGNRLFFISDYVFKTNVLKSNDGFFKLPLAWASDDISAYIGAIGNGIAHSNKPVFMYRISPHTISTKGNTYLKMDAILGEERWLNAFLKTDTKNDIDTLLVTNIKQELKKYIQKKKIRTIYSSTDIPFYKWFLHTKKYNLSITEILYSLLQIIKERKKSRYE
jgi:glycosyltransferase involved in cell wall biosynthesis